MGKTKANRNFWKEQLINKIKHDQKANPFQRVCSPPSGGVCFYRFCPLDIRSWAEASLGSFCRGFLVPSFCPEDWLSLCINI